MGREEGAASSPAAVFVQGRALQGTRRASGANEIVPAIRRDVMVGRANSTSCRAGLSGDQDTPHVPERSRIRALTEAWHYSQWSCELREQLHRPALDNPACPHMALSGSSGKSSLSLTSIGIDHLRFRTCGRSESWPKATFRNARSKISGVASASISRTLAMNRSD